MDDGVLTDSQGRKVDFRNTIIVMTSNIGSGTTPSLALSISFLCVEFLFSHSSLLSADILAQLPEGVPSSSCRSDVISRLSQYFPPEFINRIDDIILFNRLSR